MSRLQVGGLALVVGFEYEDDLLGEVVTLDEYVPVGVFDTPIGEVTEVDGWLVITKLGERFAVSSKNLLPLGDKQTQDELRKEECEA